MRTRALLTGTFVVAVALMPSTPAQAFSRSSRPAYTWALDATLVVAGRVESVGGDKGTLRITKTLAGRADAEVIEFTPASRPECLSGRMDQDQPIPADVTIGDDVALFLVKGKGAAFEVLDGGFAKVGVGAFGEHSFMTRAPLAVVERLVSVMKTADLGARDRGMIAAATAEDQILRHAACAYVEHDLGVASPPNRDGGDRAAIAAADEIHLAAVRRLGKEIAALVVRENGSEPCGAAVRALLAASCAPDGAFDDIARFARAVAPLDWWQADPACRVLALYDRPESVTWIAMFASDQPRLLETLGGSRRPEARSLLLEEFGGEQSDRVVAATRGLGALLARGRDTEVEDALLARLKGLVGPTLEEALGVALMRTRPLDAANVILDKLASPSLSKAGEDAGAQLLRAYLGATPPIAGVRELLTKRQDVLTKRLDAGKTESVWVLYLLETLGTPEATASVRHAAESHPDAEFRQEAKWRSAPLDK